MNDCLWSFLNICKSCDKCSCDNYVTANSCMAGELLGRMERMEQALREIASKKPKEKPEWGDADDSGNYDDMEANGWDICAWGVAEIAEQALKEWLPEEGSDFND